MTTLAFFTVISAAPKTAVGAAALYHLGAAFRAYGHPTVTRLVKTDFKAALPGHWRAALAAAALFVMTERVFIAAKKCAKLPYFGHHAASFTFYALNQLKQLLTKRRSKLIKL